MPITPLRDTRAAARAAAATAYDALVAIGWLSSVTPQTLERLAEQAVLHRVPAGSLIFEQAETPAFAQFLLGGKVELLGLCGKAEILVEIPPLHS